MLKTLQSLTHKQYKLAKTLARVAQIAKNLLTTLQKLAKLAKETAKAKALVHKGWIQFLEKLADFAKQYFNIGKIIPQIKCLLLVYLASNELILFSV